MGQPLKEQPQAKNSTTLGMKVLLHLPEVLRRRGPHAGEGGARREGAPARREGPRARREGRRLRARREGQGQRRRLRVRIHLLRLSRGSWNHETDAIKQSKQKKQTGHFPKSILLTLLQSYLHYIDERYTLYPMYACTMTF